MTALRTAAELAAAEAAARRRLVDVARRRAPADLLLTNARVVNVYTGELTEPCDLAVAGGRLAVVGDAAGCTGPDTEVADLGGRFVAPGFIDAHYHIESTHLSPARHCEVSLPQGTTVMVIDPHEACASGGLDAIRYFLETTDALPQKIYVQISSATPPSPVETVGGYIGADEARDALSWPRVMGLGEVMDPQRVFAGDERLWDLLQLAYERGVVIEGHSGYTGADLDAYASLGVSDSHSARTPEQALAMLRRGFHLQLKVKRSAAIVAALMEAGIDWSRVGLAVDDRTVDELVEIGGIDNEIRAAIALGIPPIAAYRMATLNNADHWGIARHHGGIAPGRYADLVVLGDLATVAIDEVYASGARWSAGSSLVRDLPPEPATDYARGTVRLARPVGAGDLAVTAPAGAAAADGGSGAAGGAPVLATQIFDTITTDGDCHATLPMVGGVLHSDPVAGISKVAVVERHRSTGNIAVGFQRWGFQAGALASSMMHDSHNIVVVGADDADMALAANRVAEMEGGMAAVRDGVVLAEVALPIWGMMTDAPVDETVEAFRLLEAAVQTLCAPTDDIRRRLGEFGSRIADAITFGFLTCHPRRYVLTDQGWFDMTKDEPLAVQR